MIRNRLSMFWQSIHPGGTSRPNCEASLARLLSFLLNIFPEQSGVTKEAMVSSPVLVLPEATETGLVRINSFTPCDITSTDLRESWEFVECEDFLPPRIQHSAGGIVGSSL